MLAAVSCLPLPYGTHAKQAGFTTRGLRELPLLLTTALGSPPAVLATALELATARGPTFKYPRLPAASLAPAGTSCMRAMLGSTGLPPIWRGRCAVKEPTGWVWAGSVVGCCQEALGWLTGHAAALWSRSQA